MRPATSRRAFLRHAALAAFPALAASRSARAIPPIGRPCPSHLKLSIAAYSYRDFLTGKSPKMDLYRFVDLAAEMGFDGVELTSYYFPPDPTPADLHRLQQHAFRLGLDISGTSVGNDFCKKDEPEREAQQRHVRTWIERAAELDAPVIRIFAGQVPKGDDEDAAVGRAIEGIKAALPYAAERGVTLALENHGGITSTPAQILKIVGAIDAPNFGVNLDTGNFHGADPYGDLAQLAPYAVNVQVKTEVQPAGKKKEEADLGRVVSILREARYSGYVVLEYEAAEDPMTAIPCYARKLRELIRS